MKLTTCILFVACIQVSAHGYGQPISLSEKNAPINDVFRKIEQQSGYLFWYNDALIRDARKVSINVAHASLQTVLDLCFNGQPFTYEIVGKVIVLKARPSPPAVAPAENPNPQTDIHGKVTDSLGSPLIGASVTIKGTNLGTRTNGKGEFDMKNVRENMVLVISYTGYESREVHVKADMDHVFIILEQSRSILDQTVVQAYGTTSRRFSVGSISTVDATTIEQQPVTNVLMALEGQAPGLAVNVASGVPGARVQLQVRGQNTVLSNSGSLKPYDQPLFIIDGVPFAPQNNNISQLNNLAMGSGDATGGISQLGGLSPFNGINPADIESISILKDADATSIYGTQGSNGVVLITTKKGKPGRTTFNLTANTGVNTPGHLMRLMNTPQYLQMRRDAFAADSITPTVAGGSFQPGYAPDLLVFDTTKYTNWEKVIYGQSSNYSDVHGSLSGGTVANNFLLSTGYTRNNYNFPGAGFNDQRLTMHSAMHHSSPNRRLNLDFGVDYSYDQNNSPTNAAGGYTTMPPDLPDLKDQSGNLVWSYKGINLNTNQFYATLEKTDMLKTNNLTTSLRLSYRVLPGLNATVNMGYSSNTSSEHFESPALIQEPGFSVSTAQFANTDFQTINIEPQLDYTYSSGKSMLTALVGGTYKKNTSYQDDIEGYGYANPLFLGSIDGAASLYGSDNTNLYKYDAGFARLKYVYAQKYILSLTGRRDGSSNFGPSHLFGNFGSVGGGWIFSEEKGFKAALPFISYSKLSASYGTSGSDGIQAYQYQAFWAPLNDQPAFQGVAPNGPVNLYNPNYGWALKKSLNVAMDLGFFHDRMLVNATFYRDREGNQLGAYPLSAEVGLTSVLENLPASVQNQGWEFTLNSTNIKTKNFTWATTFNITINRNKLLSFPNLATSSYSSLYVIGKPTSIVMGFRFAGLDPQTGLYDYYDRNGKITNTPNYGVPATGGDEMPIADQEVKYMGGFGNTFTYKRLSLYVFFQFSSQEAPNWVAALYSGSVPGNMANLPVQALSYWKQPGDQATLQRLSTLNYSASIVPALEFPQSSGAYSDDTYMRLKTLSLSYELSQKLLTRAHIQDCRIFASAQNLLTFTDYKVIDPEQAGDLTAMPIQRTVALGLNFNF